MKWTNDLKRLEWSEQITEQFEWSEQMTEEFEWSEQMTETFGGNWTNNLNIWNEVNK